ncbi:MAG: ATP-dependent helicase [Proteobacteria bacterium]|nr:ATP-dependent helicase [Pseudomonadota bacterium]
MVHGESLALSRLTLTHPSDETAPDTALADDQRRAVLHPSGAARVIAPAGSGKTRVMAARLHHLLVDRGYEADCVTAVAYNKRAASELEARVNGLGARVKTLHALGWEVLRSRGDLKLLNERDVRQRIMRLARIEPQKGRDPLAAWVEALAEVRLGLRAPADVERDRGEALVGFSDFFTRYREALKREGACDHDEQIYGAIEVLLTHPETRRRLQRQCRHLLVDEFQDLTPAYMLLIRLAASPGYQVFGVGDDDQVIYGYLGATPDFLIRYDRYFPGAASHALESNYRCHTEIVDAARRLLARNRKRVAKQITGAAPTSDGGLSVVSVDGADMANRMTETVKMLLAHGHRHQNIAVLSRVNDSLMPVQMGLRAAGVPCDTVVDGGLLERSGVRAALAWLSLASGPERMSGELLGEAMSRPARKMYRATIERVSHTDTLTEQQLKVLAKSLRDWEGDEVMQFVFDLQSLRRLAAQGATTLALLQRLRGSMGLGRDLDTLDHSRSDASGSNHVDQLIALEQVAALHPSPATFEEWVREQLRTPPDRGGVTLSTVHRVKGMEWDVVLIYHATEGLMPHRLCSDVEEERRVFHVALTRGRRMVYVFTERGRPSPFVAEANGEPVTRGPGTSARKEETPTPSSRGRRNEPRGPSRGRRRH